jgi:hypothetical protein
MKGRSCRIARPPHRPPAEQGRRRRRRARCAHLRQLVAEEGRQRAGRLNGAVALQPRKQGALDLQGCGGGTPSGGGGGACPLLLW